MKDPEPIGLCYTPFRACSIMPAVLEIYYCIDPHTSQKAGYHSQITLNDSPDSLLKNIRQLLSTPTPVEESTDVGPISNREKTILKHIAQGMTNKEIADKLFISIHTVVTHRKNITHKLGIKSVAGLTVYAILNNLITVDQVQ